MAAITNCGHDRHIDVPHNNVAYWDFSAFDAKQRMYGPAARRKMISELGEREKLHQCIRPLEWS